MFCKKRGKDTKQIFLKKHWFKIIFSLTADVFKKEKNIVSLGTKTCMGLLEAAKYFTKTP